MLREVTVENGKLLGIPAADPRITAFKGIPYAAPPVGPLRWKAPQPAADWEGVRDCSRFAPISMQETPGLNPDDIYTKEWHVDPQIPISEDSLYLNVWTPAKSVDEKLPVMIWIYGGAFN
ncbi:MAG: carboxylesterase family protein, partial [Oscillospiraceae bacterium]|nr:carboxylesterase family protein [Oscillospiraceae bacterium]